MSDIRKELHEKLLKDIAESKAIIEELGRDNDMLDEDGYPTEACLEIVRKWHWNDPKGWFEFVKENWLYSNMMWKEIDEPHAFKGDTIVHRHDVSTAGWSGNESLIQAMQENGMMWHLNWVQSRRGGHYIFEEYHVKD